MERSAPATETRQDHLNEREDRRDDGDGANALVRMPGNKRQTVASRP